MPTGHYCWNLCLLILVPGSMHCSSYGGPGFVFGRLHRPAFGAADMPVVMSLLNLTLVRIGRTARLSNKV